MRTFVVVVIFLGTTVLAASQSPDELQKNAMKEFSWLEGVWQGIGWSQMGAQNRDTFFMTETIVFNLDQTILEVEGIGKDHNGVLAHHARAILSYNTQSQKYQWHAWRIPGGIFTEYEPVLSENGFIWAMETPRGKIKYSVTHTDEDGWFEIGEFSGDGANWFKFFEMDLKRKQ